MLWWWILITLWHKSIITAWNLSVVTFCSIAHPVKAPQFHRCVAGAWVCIKQWSVNYCGILRPRAWPWFRQAVYIYETFKFRPTFSYFSVLTYTKLITNIFQPEPCDNILILTILTSSTSLHLHLATQYWSMYCSLLAIGSQEVSVWL